MILIGYFRDLAHGFDSQPAISTLVGRFDGTEDAVLSYLDSCEELAVADSPVVDVLGPQRPVIGELIIRTDGEFAWPSDLAYYVRTYDVGLPDAFLAAGRARGWQPPRFDKTDWARVNPEYRAAKRAMA